MYLNTLKENLFKPIDLMNLFADVDENLCFSMHICIGKTIIRVLFCSVIGMYTIQMILSV